MSRSMLCRTCKRPSAGEHQSWCSHSAGAVMALRATLADTSPLYAFDARSGDAIPCSACGYQVCGCGTLFSTDPSKGAFFKLAEPLTFDRMREILTNAGLLPKPAPISDAMDAFWYGVRATPMLGIPGIGRVSHGPSLQHVQSQGRDIAPQSDEDYARERGWSPHMDYAWKRGDASAWTDSEMQWQWSTGNYASEGQHGRRPTLREAIDAAELAMLPDDSHAKHVAAALSLEGKLR